MNPFAAIWGFATEKKGGLGDDGTLFDPTHWGDQSWALEDLGIGQRTGNLVQCHPMLAQSQDASAFFSNLLAYVDGFLSAEGDQLKVGWFPHQAPDLGSLPEIVEGDLEGKPSGNGFNDASAGPSDVVVIFKDRDRRYTESPASAAAPANLETGLLATAVRKERPFLHDAAQAAIVAAELAAEAGGGDDGITLNVLKSRAVDGAGAPLMPGALLNWDYGPHARDLVCRIVSRRMRTGSASDVLTLIRERGAYPRPYVAPVDPRVLPADDLPGEINVADVRLWSVPPLLTAGTRQVAALLNRTKRTIYRADLHLSPTGAAPWEIVLDTRFFSAKCAVSGAISDSAATVRVVSTSVDFARMAAQSTLAQSDDTLLLLIGGEAMSVGTIAVVTTNTYDLSILRGRRATAAAAHADAAVAWLFYRSELQANTAEHAEFYRVRDGSDVYDPAIATKRFKLALFTIYADGLAKPDDPGISLVLPDLTDDEAVAAAGYTILLTSEAHTVACDSAGTPNGGQLGAGSTAKTDVKVFRGDTALTAVASSPGTDEYSIALGALTSTTATKEDNDTVRCDTLTADTGTIAITVSIAGTITVTKIFTLTKAKSGATGPNGANGTNGTNGATGATGAQGPIGLSGLDGSTTFYGAEASVPSALRIGDVWFVTDKAFEMRRATATGTGGWVSALTGSNVFEIIGGTTYIKRAAIREVDAGVILAGNITVALALTTGSLSGGSGANAFSFSSSGAILGDSAGANSRFFNNGSVSGLYLRSGSTIKGFFGIDASGYPTLDLSGTGPGTLQGAGLVSTQRFQAFSTNDSRGSTTAIYTLGGAYISQTLDVLGPLYAAGSIYTGGSIRKVTSDGWTPAMWDGDNALAWRWDGSDLKVKVDATEFTVVLA